MRNWPKDRGGVRLLPKTFGNFKCIDPKALPPGHLVAGLMQLPMVTAAERNRKLSLTLRPAGVEFTDENRGGPRVRLRKPQPAK
jgi:hypothetical protein